jgi:hypothetical protein
MQYDCFDLFLRYARVFRVRNEIRRFNDRMHLAIGGTATPSESSMQVRLPATP